MAVARGRPPVQALQSPSIPDTTHRTTLVVHRRHNHNMQSKNGQTAVEEWQCNFLTEMLIPLVKGVEEETEDDR